MLYVGYTVHNFPHSHLTFQVGEKIAKITQICVYMYYKYTIYIIFICQMEAAAVFLGRAIPEQSESESMNIWMVKD